MLKTYGEMRKIDVTQYCEYRKEKINGKEVEIPYLNWAKCIDLLHENGAEKVYFAPCVQEGGSSLIFSRRVFSDKNENTNCVYETRIHIVIDDLEFDFQGPVMNGANPVKDNSMSQQRLWNCQCRLFVKAVAIYTGLGFDLWLKGEEKEAKLSKPEDIRHDIMKVREQVFEKVTYLQKKRMMSLDDIAAALNMERDDIEIHLRQYVQLARFENALRAI